MDSEGKKWERTEKVENRMTFLSGTVFFDLACLKTVGLAALIVVVWPGVEYPDIFPHF